MKKQRWLETLITRLLILVLGLVIVSCGSEEAATSTAEPVEEEPTAVQEEPVEEPTIESELEGDAVRGGLMYDKWWVVVEADTPSDDHPLWATQDTNTRSGADTWRCKECHGWDYKGVDGAYGSGSHMTGFTGVIQFVGGSSNEALAAMKGGTNADHDFSSFMAEQDLIDLAVFMTQVAMDMDGELINADATANGDATTGEGQYSEVCTLCHGPAGNAINFSSLDDPEFLGHLAPDNPWEFVHKVRFGQPGWPMPSAINNGWTNQEIADVLAYAQTFGTDAPLSGGGLLYDKWWAVVDADAPTEDHPLWATQDTNERSGADTWRCKECHGWDYMGADGAYGSGSHMTGFTGVLGTAPDDIMGWLDGSSNPDHDFSDVMEPYALEALVTFISQEMTDITSYVSADGSVDGDPANGRELFNGTCAACHGLDGTTINFGDDEEPEYLGTVAAGNPWEFFHKVSFGQPGEPMPAGYGLGWSMQEFADIISYVQTLPTE